MERWLAKADTLFQSELAAQSQWSFTREHARRIKQPVLNLMGEHTASYFQAVYETVKAWMPHAENDIVPDAPHAMMQTNPRATAERVAAFIGGQTISSAGYTQP